MRNGKAPNNWIRAALMSVVLGPTAAWAGFPKPLETAGRLYGVYWGDGYHACASSGIRPGADLPPKSYSARHRSGSRVAREGILHRIGATYYDRFDAANARACGSPGCGSGACDCGPVTVIHGSQVIQSLGAMNSTIAQPTQEMRLQPLMAPSMAPDTVATTSRKPDAISELTAPLADKPQPKLYPTRPEPPALLQRSDAFTVASKQMTLSLEPPAPGNWGQMIADRSQSQPVSTRTPAPIAPIHPSSPPVTPARLSLPSNPIATSTPSMVVPSPSMVVPPGIELADPAKPQVASAPARLPEAVPSQALTANDIPAPQQPPRTPARLGTQTPQAPTFDTAIDSVAVVKRPTRLGDGGLDVQVNPFATRPVVEMAKRVGGARDGVIFQPSGGSLK